MDSLRVYCLTWNVETTWPMQDLHTLLGLKEATKSDPATRPDLYIICLQEVKSQPQNVVMDIILEEPWTAEFRKTLAPFDYVKIASERLQGILTCFFVLRKHLPYMRDVHSIVARTGLGGFWGNKGATSIRFTLYGCSFCIVNSHLAPHDSGFTERCLNYDYIVDAVTFPVSPTTRILYHDYVFWLGDLNFRLSGALNPQEIEKVIQSGDLSKLLEIDELRLAQKSQSAFGPLTESTISFHPTYKYQENSDDLDLNRRPAWTDRILHQVHVDAYENVKLKLSQTKYTSVPEYNQSDHKPVIAAYEVKVFADRIDRCVEFKPINEWRLGELNLVNLIIKPHVTVTEWDYVALFKENFSCVGMYVTYSYVRQTSLLEQSLSVSSLLLPQKKEEADTTESKEDQEIQISFMDDLLQEPGMYVLLYYSKKHKSYLAMSDPFPVIRRDH